MKTNFNFMILAVLLCFNQTFGQKKYEKIIYKDVAAETESVIILGKDAVSNIESTKFKLKITNKGDDLILFKPEESTLKANSKEYKSTEKWLEIPPVESESKVIDFKSTELLIPEYSYSIDGLYKVSVINKALETPDFQLPASQNDFKTGDFTCSLIDMEKETDKTSVKFECRYTGDKVGIINPGKAAIKLPDGTEIANAKPNKAPIVLSKGETQKIHLVWNRMQGGSTTDMQKIKMLIVWRNTFVESDAIKIKPVTLEFKIDETKSK